MLTISYILYVAQDSFCSLSVAQASLKAGHPWKFSEAEQNLHPGVKPSLCAAHPPRCGEEAPAVWHTCSLSQGALLGGNALRVHLWLEVFSGRECWLKVPTDNGLKMV